MAGISTLSSSHAECPTTTNGDTISEISVTTTLAEFASATTFEDLNPALIDKLKELLLDHVGVASSAAATAESSERFLNAVLAFAGPQHGNSTVFTKGHNFAPQYAALLNAAFAHTYDFDDTHAKAALHPGAPVVPAALVQSEMSEVNGKTLLTALAVGYEVVCRISLALGPGSYSRGFHNTGTAGIFGAVAAIGRAKNLTSSIIENAFGLALSKAAGSMSFMENGSWNKRLHPGFADHDALLCIALAEAGVLGSAKALEGRKGLLHAYSDNPDSTGLVKELGTHWALMDTALKPYPACRVTHASIDLAAKLSKEKSVPVEKITVRLESAGYNLVGLPIANKIRPKNIVDAQFSNYIQTAIAWLYGNELGWSAYDKIFDKDVQELATRIEHIVDPSLQICGTKMTVLWQDGSQIEDCIEAPLGELTNPFVHEKVQKKFLSLTRPVYGEKRAHQIMDIIETIEKHNVKDLMALL
ncbi:2-methylcitrate dehydratase [Xylogone sp. PMI_703]|nr:2-methylcitrate dehydratase [Xylogone sp. PMI_703]